MTSLSLWINPGATEWPKIETKRLDSYIQVYAPILEKRKDTPFGERERNFQCHRRGRYVAFDKSILFGLQSDGRT